jgi:hypothetical protein
LDHLLMMIFFLPKNSKKLKIYIILFSIRI